MQLNYRGLRYTVNAPSLPAIENVIPGNYRGSSYQIKQYSCSVKFPIHELKYRGATYLLNDYITMPMEREKQHSENLASVQKVCTVH
ncbi:DUF4278 domain-containing protein [Aerosakkonemataceae cyanobacterium BLCC-F154]|uniref:DUF4278 domain-containing protein n=1 Tax=Floridaenema fluviatile BLCC-F154 TaxID=3153640 RepID=A0ABV4Y4M4_9CYAN